MRVLSSLIGGIFMAWAAGSAQTMNQPFVVTISVSSPAVRTGPDNYTVKAGSEVFIKVQMTSTSDRDLVVGNDYDDRFGVDSCNHYEVRDSDDNLIPKRTIKHPELGHTGHGWPGRVLKPGKTIDVDEDRITGLYDLSRPGKYTIQDQRDVWFDKPNNGVVKSNAITVVLAE
jgi:hypothetical protein